MRHDAIYENFKEEVKKAFTEYMEENYPLVKIEEVTVLKNNCKKEGFVVKENNAGPTLYYETLFEDYINGGKPFNLFIDDVIHRVIKSNNAANDKIVTFLEREINREYILKNVFPAVFNTKLNKEFFSEFKIVHRDVPELGLSIVYYINISLMSGNGISKINESVIKKFNLTEEQLYKQAMLNLKNMKHDVCSLSSFIGLPLPPEGDFLILKLENDFGAACILDEEFLRSVCDMVDDDIFIIPASVHELLVLPESYASGDMETINNLKDIVNCVSHDEDATHKENFLSDTLYMYKYKEKRLFVC